MNKQQLDEILRKHGLYLRGEAGGERANLSGANLSWANLRGADLRSIARALLRWALQKATEENDELLADREALVAFARSAWPHSDAPFPRPDQMPRILALLDHPEAQP